MNENVYLKLNDSVNVRSSVVRIKDVASLLCNDKKALAAMENKELFTFDKDGKKQKVFSILDVTEKLLDIYPEISISSVGASNVIVNYVRKSSMDNVVQVIKLICICVIAFFGAGFSIMSYNSDVNMAGQLDLMQQLFVGTGERGRDIAGIAYSVGLFIGIIILFNHGAKKKFTDDPTPLQVQMRKYEQDVDTAIIIDAERKKESENVS